MKKMFTLLAGVLLVTAAIAQYNPGYKKGYDNKSRDAVYRDNDYRNENNRRKNYFYERDLQAAKINREYDRKAGSIKNNWYMSRAKKDRIICTLEAQRRDQLQVLYDRYSYPNKNFRSKNW